MIVHVKESVPGVSDDYRGPVQPLEIVVRGGARRRYPAERATIVLAAQFDGTDKQEVYGRAVAVHEPLTADIAALNESGAVSRWNSDQLRVYSYRPADAKGMRRRIYQVGIKVEAEFVDFDELSAFLDKWALRDGVDVGHTSWDVTEDNRLAYEAELRAHAVADATAKAQAYADAAGRGKVTAVQLSDPDMLDSGHRPTRAFAMAASAPMDSVAALELRPDDIELQVAVDARFLAE